MSNKPPISRGDAKIIAETACDLADKTLYWKGRALSAEQALRDFALQHPMGDNYVSFAPKVILAARAHFDEYMPQKTILGAA